MTDIVFCPNLPRSGDGPLAVFEDFKQACAQERTEWTTSLKTREGDLFLFWFGGRVASVVGIGVRVGDTTAHSNRNGEYEWTSAKRVFLGDYSPCIFLARGITLDEIKSDPHLHSWWATRPYQGGPKTMLKHPAAAHRILALMVKRDARARSLLAGIELPKNIVIGNGKAKPKKPPRISLERVEAQLRALPAVQRERVKREIEAYVRDQGFRGAVVTALGSRCAACGQELRVNSIFECEAAHVRPVAFGGSDSGNGIPLCRTHHWAFDNYLWAFDEKLKMHVRAVSRTHLWFSSVHGRRLRLPGKQDEVRRHIGYKNIAWRWLAYRRRSDGMKNR